MESSHIDAELWDIIYIGVFILANPNRVATEIIFDVGMPKLCRKILLHLVLKLLTIRFIEPFQGT